jgi:hypothetical protein
MKTLKETFEILVGTMNRYDLCKKNDEVGIALENLSNKITEVEKRMECIRRTNKEIFDILFNHQGKIEGLIGYDDFEIIQRSTNDISIALDLDIDEPIINDWYGLFGTRNSVDETIKPTEDTVELSGGGIPYKVCYHCAIKEEETVMQTMNNFVLCNDCYDEVNDTETNLAKKDSIEKILISKWANIGMDIPSNFEDIVQFIYEDVCETADPIEWNDYDVIIGFRRWIESK